MDIRSRMLIAFLVATLFSVGALSIIAFENSAHSIEQEVEASLNSVIEEKVAHIYSYIHKKEQDVMLSATQPIIAQALSQLTAAFKQGHNSREYLAQDASFREYLQQLKERLNGYELFLISPSGDVVFSVLHESSFASNLNTGPFYRSQLAMSFKKASRLLETQVSQFKPFAPSQWQGPIEIGKVEKKIDGTTYGQEAHSAFIAAPVFKGDQLLGVLATQLNSSDYYHLATDYTALKETGEIVIGKQVNNMALVIAPLRSEPNAAFNLKFSMDSETAPILQKSLRGEKGSGLSIDYRGRNILAAWRHIPELQWGIVVKIDADEAFASANQLQIKFAITGAVIILLSSLIAVYFSHLLTAPILKLVKSTEAMTEGDLSQDIESNSSDEIGRLATSFNLMLKARRRYTQELKDSAYQSQKALQELADHKFVLDQHAIVAATDIDGTITFANEKFSQTSGYSNQELVGQNHRILNSGTHSPQMFAKMYETISQGQVWHGDLCNKAKDGHLYWVYCTIVPIMKNGKPESYLAIRSDISERKKLEIEYQRVARFALENPGLVLKVSPKNTIIFANPSALKALKTLNLSRGDLAPKDWRHAIQTVLTSKSIFRFEEKFDDTAILLTLKYVEDPSGASVNIYGSDISDLKQVEDDLIKAKVSAEQAAIAKSEFLASMSHEIRTPMNGVLGMLGLLLETELSAEQKRKTVIAQSSAESLLSIINNILDFSKIEAGKLSLEKLDFNLRDYLGDFAEAMAIHAQEKDLELILDLTEIEQSLVRGDPGRLRQILTNLVSNAIKFTEQGEVIIRAKLEDYKIHQLSFTCSIEDTGIGIPKNKLSILFDSFSQGDASTTRKYGGTGLGLAIVQQLCELMGGNVTVTSEVNQGSKFSFNVILQTSEASQKVQSFVDIHAANILIVDDNASSRTALKKQLEYWGACVSEAQDATSALKILADKNLENQTINSPISTRSSPFSLAFIDMHMPDTDGIALGKKIRSDQNYDLMPLVLMTQISSKDDNQYYSCLGFSAYFPKPTTTHDLLTVLPLVQECNHTNDLRLSSEKPQYCQPNAKEKINSIAGTKILLVEDNIINQEVAINVLTRFGVRCDIAANGYEAISALKQRQSIEPYQLVLMDCQMPEMDGFDATGCIRRGEAGYQYRTIPIIAMTANAMKGDREKCLAAGMTDYTSKPIDPDLLKNKIHKCLFNETVSQSSDEHHDADTDYELLDLQIWDKKAMLKRLGNNTTTMLKLVGLFISGIPKIVDRLESAISQQDYSLAGAEAHAIKGVAANISGLRIQHLALQMEIAGKNANKEKVDALLPIFKQHFEELIERLNQEE